MQGGRLKSYRFGWGRQGESNVIKEIEGGVLFGWLVS